MKYFVSKKRVYTVEETGNPAKPLIVKWLDRDIEHKKAGYMIAGLGGVDKFLSLCIDEGSYLLYKNDSGFREEHDRIIEEAKKAASRVMKESVESLKAQKYQHLLASSGGVIETTAENISIVLGYLNTVNWGGWELPKMSIGYSCNQYDCDGRTATTMKLDEPVEYEGELVDKFVTGAPVGHLTKYRRI